MSTAPTKRLTVDEYLAHEERAEVRHEYFDGELFAMAGGTARHSSVKVNAVAALHAALQASGCRVYDSDMMVRCPTGLRTYPDVSVTCESPRFETDREVTLLNPQVIVEVLSETTEAYDRGKKFEHYQAIESLAEYWLIASDHRHVDHFARADDGRWILTGLSDEACEVVSATLGVSIRLADLYAGIEFPDGASNGPSR